MMHLEVIYYTLKALGLVCVIGGCSGFGFLQSRELSLRIDHLRELKKILLELQNEIRFLSAPIPEIFEKVAGKCGGQYHLFFDYICKKLEERAGEPIEKVWEIAADSFLSKLELKKTDIRLIKEIGNQLGKSDKKAQLSLLELYMEQIDLNIKELSFQIDKKKKLYQCLGLFSGLIIALCLV